MAISTVFNVAVLALGAGIHTSQQLHRRELIRGGLRIVHERTPAALAITIAPKIKVVAELATLLPVLDRLHSLICCHHGGIEATRTRVPFSWLLFGFGWRSCQPMGQRSCDLRRRSGSPRDCGPGTGFR